MWLYQRECSPTSATHESFCSTRPSASASPHIVYTTIMMMMMTSDVAGEPRQVQLIGHRDGLRRANHCLTANCAVLAHSRRRLRTRRSCARQPMISLPAFFVAYEPSRVDAAPVCIAVERRDTLGFDLVTAVQIALPFSRASFRSASRYARWSCVRSTRAWCLLSTRWP
jgi:hypothetical protein